MLFLQLCSKSKINLKVSFFKAGFESSSFYGSEMDLFLFLLFFFFFFFLGPHLWHMEAPRLGISSELLALA